MSDKFNNSEFFDENFLKPLKENARAALEQVDLLTQGLKEAAAAAGVKIAALTPDSLDNLKKINTALHEVEVSDRGLVEAMKVREKLTAKLADLDSRQAIEIQKTKEQIRERTKANKEAARDQLGLNTAYQKASKLLNEYRLAYKNLALAGREQGKVGRGLLQTITEMDERLKALDATTGQHQRNVGHYELALGKLGKGIKAASGLLGELGQAFGFNTEAMESIIRIGAAVSKTLKEIHHAQNLAKVAMQANTAATKANTAAQESNLAFQQKEATAKKEQAAATDAMAAAQGKNAKATKLSWIEQLKLNWAIRANPYFLAVAALGALVVGIMSYIHFSEIAEQAEKRRSTALDGTIIKDKEARDSYNESIIVLKRLSVQWDLLRGDITETEAAVLDMTISYEDSMKKLSDTTQDKIAEAQGFWSEFKNGFVDIGRLFTDEDYGLTYGIGQTQKDINELNENFARQAAIDKEAFEKEKALKQAEADKKEREEIEKNDADAMRRIRSLNNEKIKNTHERNLAIINENADFARQDLINTKMSEYMKTNLIAAIMAKRDADIAKENEDYYRKNRDAVNNSEDRLYYDKLNHDKEDLKRKADQDRKMADLTIIDAVELANARIGIENDLQDGLAAIDKAILELKAKRDIQAINDSELSAATKKKLILNIQENLVAEEAYIDKKAGEDKADTADEEFQNAIDRMNEENDRIIAEGEEHAEKLKALEKKKYNDLQRIRILKAGTDEKALRKAAEVNEQEDYLRDLKLLEGAHDAGVKSEEDYLRELELLNLEHEKRMKEIKSDSIEELMGLEKQLQDAIADGLDRRFDKRQAALDREGEMIDSRLTTQAELFARGLENTLAFEEKAKADQIAKMAELDEKRRKSEEAQQLASVFFEFVKTYAKDGSIDAAGKALAQTLIVKSVGDLIAGSAYEGTPDTGPGAKGWDDKGGQPWLLHPNEAVIPKDRNQENPGLASAWIRGDLDNYFRDIYLPQWGASLGTEDGPAALPSSNHQLIGLLNHRLASLENTVKNKKESHAEWDSVGNLVLTEIENGFRRQRIKKKF